MSAKPVAMSRSLSDMPFRNLTSFLLAAASIVSGKHHDRLGHVKREDVGMSRDKPSLVDLSSQAGDLLWLPVAVPTAHV